MNKNDGYILRNVPWKKERLGFKRSLDLDTLPERGTIEYGIDDVMKPIYDGAKLIAKELDNMIMQQLSLMNLTIDDIEGFRWKDVTTMEEIYEIYYKGFPTSEPLIVVKKPPSFAMPVLVKGVDKI